VDLLGTSLVAWLGFAVLGGAFGLALQVVATPQGSALPAWLPRARIEEVTHALYGVAVGVLGALFVSLFGGVLGILYDKLGDLGAAVLVALWCGLVTWAAVAGSEGKQRERILRAHAKTLGALFALVLVAVSVGRMVVFRDYLRG
jgi:hypothetical protein